MACDDSELERTALSCDLATLTSFWLRSRFCWAFAPCSWSISRLSQLVVFQPHNLWPFPNIIITCARGGDSRTLPMVSMRLRLWTFVPFPFLPWDRSEIWECGRYVLRLLASYQKTRGPDVFFSFGLYFFNGCKFPMRINEDNPKRIFRLVGYLPSLYR